MSPRPLNALFSRACVILLGASMLASYPAHAATRTWDGGGADDNWTTGGNWDAGTAPVASDSLVFDQGFRLAAVNNFAAATQFNGLSFGVSAGAFTLTGNSITLGGNITQLSLNAQSSSIALILGTTPTIDVAQRNGALTLTGVISGGHGLTKTGTGLLTLGSATNTFTGPVTVTGGTLSIDSDARLGAVPGVATAGRIVLNGGSLRITGGTISTNRGITVGNGSSGTGTLDVQAATSYAGIIAGPGGGLTKTGASQLTLTGANTYTGATTINQGTLFLDGSTTGSISSSSALVLGGANTSLAPVSQTVNAPTLLVQAPTGLFGSTQTFAGLTLNQANANVAFRSSGTLADTLALGAITRNAGGFVNLTRLKDGALSGNAVVTTSTANTNGILGGWAVTNADGANGALAVAAATDWAANDGAGNIVAYAGYTIPTGVAPTLANNASNNVRITSGSTGNVSLTFASNVSDLNTIQMTDTANRTVTIGSGNTLRLGASAGVWKTSTSSNVLTITGGTLTAGGAPNTAGEIVFNNAGGNEGITVSSVLANNGTGVVSLTKAGAGGIRFTAQGTYTGNTYINQGRFDASNSALTSGTLGGNGTTAGSGTIHIQPSGQLFISGGPANVGNNIVVSGSGTENENFGAIRFGNTTTVGTSTSTITLVGDTRFGRNGDTNIATIAGRLTGDFNFEMTAGGAGTEANRNVFVFSNSTNDMGGNLGINANSLGAGQTPGAGTGSVVQLRLGAANVIANGAGKGNVFIGGNSTAGQNSFLDLNGFSETINGLVSVGAGTQARVTNGRTGSPGAAATLTVGDGDATATFAGIIENGVIGSVDFTKIGAGTQTLSGANTYTGATTINGGTLAVTGSLAASSAGSINTGGTLAGTGTVGAMTLNSGGTLAPGVGGLGTLTGTSFTWNGGGTFAFDLNSTGSTSDVLALSGAFTKGTAGSYAFDFGQSGSQTTYTLATFGSFSGFTVGDFSFVNLSPALSGYFTLNAGSLQFTAVPEPPHFALAIAGMLALVVLGRRRALGKR